MPWKTLRQLAASASLPAPHTGQDEGESWEVELPLPPSLRCFEGHFPDAPMMPGIAQMLLVRLLVSRWLGRPLTLRQVASARMTEPLLPHDTCRISLRVTPGADEAGWRVTAQLHKGERRCTRLTLWLGSADHKAP